MELSINLPEETRYDSGQHRDLVVDAVWPDSLHAFFRDRPRRTIKSYRNAHGQYVLFICLRGCDCVVVEKVPCILRENDALLVFPGQPHIRQPVPEVEVAESLLIRFSTKEPRWLPELRGQIISLDAERRQKAREFAAAFETVSNHPGAVNAVECACRLASLLNGLRASAEPMADRVDVEAAPGLAYVRKACRVLLESGGKPISFAAMARKLGVSDGYLRVLFRRYLFKSPGEVWKEARSRRAQNLLLHSQLNISEIAEACGFSGVYSFSRFFRSTTGESPSHYRKRLVTKPTQLSDANANGDSDGFLS